MMAAGSVTIAGVEAAARPLRPRLRRRLTGSPTSPLMRYGAHYLLLTQQRFQDLDGIRRHDKPHLVLPLAEV